MKSKKSLEQGICILLIIAHAPADQCITSEHLSRRLGVSYSYLKKNYPPSGSGRTDSV